MLTYLSSQEISQEASYSFAVKGGSSKNTEGGGEDRSEGLRGKRGLILQDLCRGLVLGRRVATCLQTHWKSIVKATLLVFTEVTMKSM